MAAAFEGGEVAAVPAVAACTPPVVVLAGPAAAPAAPGAMAPGRNAQRIFVRLS